MSQIEIALLSYSCVITLIMTFNYFSTIAGMLKLRSLYEEIIETHQTIHRVTESEIKRLKQGDFTEEEFQELCHNFDESDECRFKAGCEAYQKKLFGEKALNEPIPADVYFDDVYQRFTTDNPKLRVPPDFYEKWISRSAEFPPIDQIEGGTEALVALFKDV